MKVLTTFIGKIFINSKQKDYDTISTEDTEPVRFPNT